MHHLTMVKMRCPLTGCLRATRRRWTPCTSTTACCTRAQEIEPSKPLTWWWVVNEITAAICQDVPEYLLWNNVATLLFLNFVVESQMRWYVRGSQLQSELPVGLSGSKPASSPLFWFQWPDHTLLQPQGKSQAFYLNCHMLVSQQHWIIDTLYFALVHRHGNSSSSSLCLIESSASTAAGKLCMLVWRMAQWWPLTLRWKIKHKQECL